ncbi:vinorine synthase [Cinnamomum micranthum f. kanehirae]|uniref:Vinorine synthase n=1 Tax=Cinnamomum micranthum f. kanehirae TaxID=337451 RepID=A0A443PTS1_9MAGN|nr:vinorine synthase [Cinnamomum micranthum f. kanehirae]
MKEMWEVELISTDTIKPSSPSPHHLRTFKLGRLDQLSPAIFFRLLLFYSSPTIAVETVQKLKINAEGCTVDCNDHGVDFLVTKVRGQLHDFLNDPDPDVGDKFLPCDATSARSGRDVLLAVQVNIFDCGGYVVGIGISHKLADGWVGRMARAREAGDVAVPTFDSPKLFPPMKVPWTDPAIVTIKENLLARRFVFDGPNMARLRGGNHSGSIASRPTRAEAVSALIFRCYMRARRESTRAIVALHAVCLRKWMVPPLQESSFGNLWTCAVMALPPEGEEECQEDMRRRLERQLRDAMKVIDGDYVRELEGPHGPILDHEPLNAIKEKCSKCAVDIPGDGVEAWVCLEEEVMARFEQDEEWLSFVSPPNPVAAEA